MSRQRLGPHGKAVERVNGSVMMTIRHEPSVYQDTDLAMLIGRELEIQRSGYYSGSTDPTREEAIQAIWEFENSNGQFTQKSFVEMITDNYYNALYDMGADNFEYFNAELPHHQVLLELVRRIFPKFKEAAFKTTFGDTEAAQESEE